MSPSMTHPELPSYQDAGLPRHSGGQLPDPNDAPAFSTYDIRAYGLACYRAGLLKAAGIADKERGEHGDPAHLMSERPDEAHTLGWIAALDDVAAAIRKEAAEP
jgi:hypothetical protein